MAEVTDYIADKNIMYVVKLGKTLHEYTVPGFSVITVALRHAKIQKSSSDEEMKLFDVFFNAEIASGLCPPTGIVVLESCYVEVT